MVNARSKTKSARKPPARARYEQSHPVVSCRLSRDQYELLKQRLDDLGGVSFADFVKDALGIIKRDMGDVKRIRETAYTAGYERGKQEHQIWYRCAVCGQRLDVVPKSEPHKAIVGLMKQAGWGHASCHQQKLSGSAPQ